MTEKARDDSFHEATLPAAGLAAKREAIGLKDLAIEAIVDLCAIVLGLVDFSGSRI